MKKDSTATTLVQAGINADQQHGAVAPPIVLSATYSYTGFGGPRQYEYTRTANPTRDVLAHALADAEGGLGSVITSSGLSAVLLLLHWLEPGQRVVAAHDCYGGTHRMLSALAKKGAFEVEFTDLSDAKRRRAALERPARLVWAETPSNPLLRITDIRAAVADARAAGALVVVDNTFLSPVLQRPFELGADLVVHSTTKYLNGHGDVVGGAVVVRDDEKLLEDLAWWANCLGITGAPFDSYMTLRGLRTLEARMRVHQENAAAIVELLKAHDAVTRVFYPGLPEHPGHEIAAAQQNGFGGMVSFELRGGIDAVAAFVNGLECFTLAESLGGVESLVSHSATMTHAGMDPEARREAGIGEGLLRFSVGIETLADLERDVEAALDRALTVTNA